MAIIFPRYHNETKISASRRHKFKIEKSENKLFYICFLEILDVEASDAGTYKAVARSSMGEGHATINLNFEEGKKTSSRLLLHPW